MRLIETGTGSVKIALVMTLLLLTTAIAGCLGDGDEDDEDVTVTITFMVPELEPRTEGQETVWDATVAVDRVSSTDHGDVLWTDLWAAILDSTGQIIPLNSPIPADGGTYGGTVEAWYVDPTGGSDTMDAGDAIKVTSLNLTHEGWTVTIYSNSGQGGSFHLPSDFP